MNRPASTRFPFEPLAAFACSSTIKVLASRIGVSRRTLHRWAVEGVPVERADRAAIALGTHPACPWPEHWTPAA